MARRARVIQRKAPKMPSMPQMSPEEMQYLYKPVNKSFTITIPRSAAVELESSPLVCIWLNYIDANKTLQMGRRVPKSIAIPGPTVEEVSEACVQLQLQHVRHPYSLYPRDCGSPGRVRVELQRNGNVVNESVPTS